MATDLDHVRSLIEKHWHRQSLPNPYRDELGELDWPKIIGTPSGRGVLFDQGMLDAASDLAENIAAKNNDHKRTFRDADWKNLIHIKVAYALDRSNQNGDLEETAKQVLNDVNTSLEQHRMGLGQFEFAFGCTLFSDLRPAPFSIGPVTFETKEDWLARHLAANAIQNATAAYVQECWESTVPAGELKGLEVDLADAILALTRDAPFVCSVVTTGISYEFGQQNAKTTARLALTAVALIWMRSSFALADMNLVEDRVERNLASLSFRDGNPASRGRRWSCGNGASLSSAKWDQLRQDFADEWAIIAEILHLIVDPTRQTQRPKTMHALTHALLWFHQGCREIEPVIAVTNFASALDCLVEGEGRTGKKEKNNKTKPVYGIIHMIEARLGYKADSRPWWTLGKTVTEVVDEICDHARNAVIHGLWDRGIRGPASDPFRDWSTVRTRAEQLTRLLLLACMDWAIQNPKIDCPLHWRTSTPESCKSTPCGG